MRVAVVTPFYKPDPAWLTQCHASVRAQTHPCTHILVSDGDGPQPLPDFQGQFIQLQHNHGDYGDTPRGLASVSAMGQGFEGVAYLDADNWYHPEHIASLVALHRKTGAAACNSRRMLHALDGSELGLCPDSDGRVFADTNCMFFTRQAFPAIGLWALIPAGYHVVGDRWVWARLRQQGISTAQTGQASVAYRTSWPQHYRQFGREVPAGAKPDRVGQDALRRAVEMADLLSKPRG